MQGARPVFDGQKELGADALAGIGLQDANEDMRTMSGASYPASLCSQATNQALTMFGHKEDI